MKERNYRMRVYPIDDGTDEVEWIAEFPDLPGCVGAGDTPEEAVAMAFDAQKAWIATAMEEGRNIPAPSDIYGTEYSGKFTLRIPKTLHRELAIRAEEEGVSLNQYILYLISKGIGSDQVSAAKDSNKTIKYELKFLKAVVAPWREESDLEGNFLIGPHSFIRGKGGLKYGWYK
ncbi:MAG: toxin-antitoxin system HicB family antitoxin [bacterium]